MQKENKRLALVITSILIVTIIAVVGISFAYFSASINGNAQNISVKAARLGSLEYTPIDNLNLGDAAMPGASSEADFTVKYVGSGVDLTYDLELTVTADTFDCLGTDKQLMMTITGSTNGSNTPINASSNVLDISKITNKQSITSGVSPTIEATTEDKLVLNLTDGYKIKPDDNDKTYKIIKKVRISEGEIHTYKVNLAFINYVDINQDENQNAIFNAHMQISNQQVYGENAKLPRLIDGCKTVGCEVAIGDEHFNIFKIDDDNVMLLSKYNLNLDVQDEKARGEISADRVENQNDYIASIDADDVYYFNGAISFGNSDDYENSRIKDYVTSYGIYISDELGSDITGARLLSKEEIQSTFQDSSCEGSYYTPCSHKDGYEWMLNTSFWTSSVAHSDYYSSVWCYKSKGYFYSQSIYDSNTLGVRPLIIIPASLLQ